LGALVRRYEPNYYGQVETDSSKDSRVTA